MATTFDTLIHVKKLKEAGFTDPEAEIQAAVLKEFSDEFVLVRHDIQELDRKIDKKTDKLEEHLHRLDWKLNALITLFGIATVLMGFLKVTG